jgi:hypothetical protein
MGWETKGAAAGSAGGSFDQGDPIQQRERLTIEKAMQTTQRAVEEKEAEINRLQALLEQQATAVDATTAVGAQGIAGILESDELIREERENLIRLQDECREKMRKAEVELAVERAKIARERSAVDEKLRDIEAKVNAIQRATKNETPQDRLSRRHRWLAQLGLINPDDPE